MYYYIMDKLYNKALKLGASDFGESKITLKILKVSHLKVFFVL